jgi:chitodextrinase
MPGNKCRFKKGSFMTSGCRFSRLSSLRVHACLRGMVLALAVMFVLPAHAFFDRIKPTVPKNFRVTAVTPFSVSLAWSPSTDNSGRFTYRLSSTKAGAGSGLTTVLPKTATSYTWRTLIFPATTYTFGLYAIDDAGNASAQVTVTVTTAPDTIAPSVAPVITVEHVNSTYVSLRWSPAVDDGPYLFYEVWLNGAPHVSTGGNRSITIDQLTPETTYTFTVLARDYANNPSPFSSPVTLTTAAPGTVDTTPPTRPEDFALTDLGCGNVLLTWTQSTDDFTAQSNLRYDIYVDGFFDHSVVGVGSTTAFSGMGISVFDIQAVDESENYSLVNSLDARLSGCP